MKKLILAGVTVTALGLMAMSPAEARDGCGPYKYRAWNGRCYWLRPPPPPPAISFGFYGGPWGWHRHWGHRW